MNNRLLGSVGENLAVAYLCGKGHEILERNFRTKLGEIDIISRKGRKIHFIEVKTRSQDKYGKPAYAVTGERLSRMRKAAEIYILREKQWDKEENMEYSLDVMEVTVNHLEGVE